MSRSKELKKLINTLNESFTEEDILKNLIQIVKSFGPSDYRDLFLNPFYKCLIPDIKKVVLKEISFLRNSIVQEIDSIDTELKKVDNPNEDKLRNIKRDCISLIYEIDEKQKDIENLS